MNATLITSKPQSPPCGAKNRSGGVCKNPGNGNGGRCRMHGGRSLSGVAHPNFKDGRRSTYSYLPKNLSERATEFATDPELTRLHELIATCDARLTELYEQLSTGNNKQAWDEVKTNHNKQAEAFSQIIEAVEAGFMPFEEIKAFRTLQSETKGILDGSYSHQTWEEILKVMDLRKKLSESENKRIKDSADIMTAAQTEILIALVLSTIRENVRDKETLINISRQLAAHNITTQSPATMTIDVQPEQQPS